MGKITSENFLRKYAFIVGALIMTFFITESEEMDVNALNIKHEIVKTVVKTDAGERREIFTTYETKELCAVATKRLRLRYLDKEDEPDIYTYKFEYEDRTIATESALQCATLPSVYLYPGEVFNEIIAVSVESVASHFKMTVEKREPISISLQMTQLTTNPIRKFNHNDRQNLCVSGVSGSVDIIFIDNYVLKPHAYEFLYPNEQTIYNAIPCPTYPRIYLRLGTLSNEIIVTFTRPKFREIEIFKNVQPVQNDRREKEQERNLDGISGKTKICSQTASTTEVELENVMNKKLLTSLYEMDRRALCASARYRIHYEIELQNTTRPIERPAFFEFDYGNGLKKVNFAIRCSSNDHMFIHLGDSNTGFRIALSKSLLLESIANENESQETTSY